MDIMFENELQKIN